MPNILGFLAGGAKYPTVMGVPCSFPEGVLVLNCMGVPNFL